MPTVSTFTSIISQLLPEPHAGLLSGILFGVKQTLDPDLKEALIATGTLHIVALSGMNITMLSHMIVNSFLFLLPRRAAAAVSIFVIIGFICFVGPTASVVRAGIMGALTLVGVIVGKNVFSLWSWGVAVALMVIVKPGWITDLSFQLSALASLGMILFGDSKPENSASKMGVSIFSPFYKLLQSDLRTTLAAQTLTIPLLFFTFGRLSLVSPCTNVLIVWTLPVLTVLGFLVCFGGYIFLPIGQVIAWGAWIFLEYILQVILWTAKIPGASIGG